jgi:hypothetical protein
VGAPVLGHPRGLRFKNDRVARGLVCLDIEGNLERAGAVGV